MQALCLRIPLRVGIVRLHEAQCVAEARRGRGRAAILPDGTLAPCVLGRILPVGNVRDSALADLFNGQAWRQTVDSIPPMRGDACQPSDSSDCNPSTTTACSPAFG